MPNQGFINHHSLELLKAALPYMNPQIQKSVEVVTKADEFINMLQSPGPSSDLSTMSISPDQMNFEDVLQQLKAVSNKNESEMLDNVTNLLKMQKMIQSYRSFMNTKQTSSQNASTNSQDTMMEFLLSQLTPEQKSNFENINIVLNAMNN